MMATVCLCLCLSVFQSVCVCGCDDIDQTHACQKLTVWKTSSTASIDRVIHMCPLIWCISMYLCMYTYVHICLWVWIWICLCICVCTCIRVCRIRIYAICIHVYMNISCISPLADTSRAPASGQIQHRYVRCQNFRHVLLCYVTCEFWHPAHGM